MERILSRQLFILLSEYAASTNQNFIKKVLRENDQDILIETSLTDDALDEMIIEVKKKYISYLDNLKL
jgi:hypothetical protein